jgi:glycosyltransferase involved in cell wall biosynthesis
LPVIGVRAMALPELVHPGANGCLFDPGDESGVADCITAVFADSSRRKEMSAGSLAIIERHDIEQTINQFESIYRSLVAKKNSK